MKKNESNDKNNGRNKWYELYYSKTTRKWFEDKRKIDDLDGLWRIHDGLYDVTDFISKHPGGRFWLEETKGLDITEAFESHHIKSDVPERILGRFFIKKATKPRSSQYTFNDDGFYKTFKRKVRVVLKTLPKDCHKLTNLYIDLFFFTAFVLATLASAFSLYSFAVLASISGSFVVLATHNYIHQRDNFRMFYGNFFMMSAREFRLVHALSHHAYSNSRFDLQLSSALPFLNVFPEKKSFVVKYSAWITCNLIIFPSVLLVFGVISIVESLVQGRSLIYPVLPLVLPTAMFCVSDRTLLETTVMWLTILSISSIIFGTVTYTLTHVHPDLYIEGDAMRPKEELDWGINQIDTACDRKEIMGNQLASLIAFGDHALHHLLPTVDHSYLKHLYPVLEETLKQFNIKNINITTTADLHLGFFRQAAREVPKSIPPSLEKVY